MLAKVHCSAVQGIVDLHVEVPQVKFQEITAKRDGEPSAAIRERVIAARQIQEKRFDGNIRLTCNARMQAREIKQHCQLGDEQRICCGWR